MRFDLFGFELTAIRGVLRLLGVMFWTVGPGGQYQEGFTRHLLYISKDPIGWKFQILFFSFHDSYLRKYNALMFQMKYPHGVPTKTKGVKSEEKGKMVPLGPKVTDEVKPEP